MDSKLYHRIFFLIILSALFFCSCSDDIKEPGERPNIIVIMADDLGYGSLNCYGADENLLRTPNIDRIANEGMRFTDASTPSSVCTPTRYGLLLGRYPWRSMLKYRTLSPTEPLLPDPDRVTIADWLKQRGYNTAAIGKWHLGYGTADTIDYTSTLSPGPLDLGFDYHFAVPQNHGDKIGIYVENDKVYGLRSKNIKRFSESTYDKSFLGVDAPQRVDNEVMKNLTDRAIGWIEKQTPEVPFFLYFTPVAVHNPITPSDSMRGTSNCGLYGDFIQDLDLSVGRILKTLDETGISENTILIFTSDNGGGIPYKKKESPQIKAINMGLRINGILRGDKGSIWEGGTRVPFIVRWPMKVKEGSESELMINLIDIYATLAEILDGEVPDPILAAPDSYSFLSSLIQSGSKCGRTSMVTANIFGIQAIRIGKWKYIDDIIPDGIPQHKMKRARRIKPQLYNLENDQSEKVNLYDPDSDVCIELKAELEKIRVTEPDRE